MANYKRRDANHFAIKSALWAAGVAVHDASYFHGFGCDLVAQHRDGRVLFLEVKRPGSEKRLTDSEVALKTRFPECFYVVTSAEQALRAVGLAA